MNASLKRELAGIALLLLGVFVAGALLLQPATGDVACWSTTGFFGPLGSCVKAGLVSFVGLAAAWLLPLAAFVHGLRYLGRMESSTDRSWMIFLLGFAFLLPIGIALSIGANSDSSEYAGLWGSFLAYYLREGFGSAGAWILLLLLTSALMAWTLRWNPIRAVIGGAKRPQMVLATPDAGAALMEPPPHEFPGIDDAPISVEEAGAEAPLVRPRKERKPPKSREKVATPALTDAGTPPVVPVVAGEDALL